MRQLPLSQNKFAIVDDEDYEYLSQFKWFYKNGYAARNLKVNNKRITIFLHNVILTPGEGFIVDHINNDSLDNCRINLRIVTRSQNSKNRSGNKNKKSYKGVYWFKKLNKWKARIKVDYKEIHLGLFNTAEEAALAYNQAALTYFGEYAKVNKI